MTHKELKTLIESLSKIEKDMMKTKEKIMDLKQTLREKILKKNIEKLKKL